MIFQHLSSKNELINLKKINLLVIADVPFLSVVGLTTMVTLQSREKEEKDEGPGEAQCPSHAERVRPRTLIRHCTEPSHQDLPKAQPARDALWP